MSGNEIIELSLTEWISWLWINEYYTLWFLKNLIVFIILTPVIWLFLNNHIKNVPSGLFFLVIVIILKNYYLTDLDYINGIELYLAGSYIGLNGRKWLEYKNKIVSFVSLVYVLFMLFTFFKFWNVCTQIIMFISLWFVIDLLGGVLEKNYPWWMSITFFVYVAHDIPLEALEKILFKVGGNSAVLALLDYLLMPFIVYALLIGIAYIVRKLMPLLWKVCTGRP